MSFEEPERILLHRNSIEKVIKGTIPPPSTIDLEISWDCNHSCVWCVYRESHKRQFMNVSIVNAVLEYAERNNVPWIVLSGAGEPTLHPKFSAIIASLEAKELNYALFTNGSNLSVLEGESLNHCRYLRVSLDAADPNTWLRTHRPTTSEPSYRSIIGGIREIVHRRTQTKVGLSFVVNRANRLEVPEFVALSASLGVDEVLIRGDIDDNSLQVHHYQSSWPEPISARVVVRRRGRIGNPSATKCFAIALKMVVAPDGSIPLCCLKRDIKSSLGNVNESPIEACWGSSLHRRFLSTISPSECSPCRFSEANSIVEAHLSANRFTDLL